MWCVLARNRNKRAILSRSSVAAYFLFSWNVYLFGLFLCFCVFFLSRHLMLLFFSLGLWLWLKAGTQCQPQLIYKLKQSISVQIKWIFCFICHYLIRNKHAALYIDEPVVHRRRRTPTWDESSEWNISKYVQVYYINRQPNDGIYICCGGKVAWQIFSLIPAEIEPNKLRASQQFFFFCSVMK